MSKDHSPKDAPSPVNPKRSAKTASRNPFRGRAADGKSGIGGGDSRGTSTGPLPSGRATRETIESVVIAFVLAFLFRTFEAEAFVIPTGSMAPTLQGAHKDVVCPQCGYRYRAGASSENDHPENVQHRLQGQQPARQQANEGLGDEEKRKVVSCVCPMCRWTMTVAPWNNEKDAKVQPTYSGDRILVGKFAYELGEPRRWDVFVFHYPQEAKTNYIKRLVGLPGETIRIHRGDLYMKPSGDDEASFRILRDRSSSKLQAMLQDVHDNHYLSIALHQAGWPHRWQPENQQAGGGWTSTITNVSEVRAKQTLQIDGTASGPEWIRYQHLIPSFDDWDAVFTQDELSPSPQLITDFYAYNTSKNRFFADQEKSIAPGPQQLGQHWVGDLAVECELELLGDDGTLVLELVEGGEKLQCHVNLGDGQATLRIVGRDDFAPTATTGVRGPGSHQLMFANVNDRLLLWVDGSLVEFDASTDFPPGFDTGRPTKDDLAPVGIASFGAAVQVNRLKVRRDIYYIAVQYGETSRDAMTEYDQPIQDIISNPQQWDIIDPHRTIIPGRPGKVDFDLGPDQFLALGDNSPQSADSRLWSQGHVVRRDLLIGKALYIYWPHGWKIPLVNLHLWPNFKQMKLVR